MAFAYLRYYYYLQDDEPKANELAEAYIRHGFEHISVKSGPSKNFTLKRTLYRIEQDNVIILVACLSEPSTIWEEYSSRLADIEKNLNLKFDAQDLLAQVNVLVSEEQNWQELLKEVAVAKSVHDPLELNLQKGKLVRLGLRWAKGQAHYLMSSPSLHDADQTAFLVYDLSGLEARALKLNFTSLLFRDRNNLITKEIGGFEHNLSAILHSQLVIPNNSHDTVRQIEDLDSHIHHLSYAYGILSTNHSVMAEDYNNIQNQILLLKKQLHQIKFLIPNDNMLEWLFSSYQKRSEDMGRTLERINISRDNHKAALEVVRSRIDIILSRENIITQGQIRNMMELNTSMQKQSLVFQIAAGIIEFIVLAYYSHSLWKNIAHASDFVAAWIQFTVTMVVSFNIVYCTHLAAEYLQGDKHVKNRLGVSSAILLLLFMGIVTGSAYAVRYGTPY